MRVLGIDIGGTKSGVLLAEVNGGEVNFLDRRTFPTVHGQGADAVLDKLVSESNDMLLSQKVDKKDIVAAGINCGGPLDSKKGIILCPPNLPDWVNVPVVSILTERLGIPCFLQNDANAGALAEYLFGAGKGYENLMFLTFGTGMGAGLVLNGRLYAGTNDMAGEVGHIRLAEYGPVGFAKAGSFEGFCSGGGLAQLGKTMALEKLQAGVSPAYCPSFSDMESITAKTIADAARARDETAQAVFRLCGQKLGQALSLFIDILNPELILLGSIYGRCEDLLAEEMNRVIASETIPFARAVCRVLPCGLGESVNEYEAVAIAVDAVKNKLSGSVE